jgi:hypothetical protein
MHPEIALTQAGVLVNVLATGYDDYTPEQRDQVIAAFPRVMISRMSSLNFRLALP